MKTFMEPTIEILKFVVEDVITTSGGPNDDNQMDEDEF